MSMPVEIELNPVDFVTVGTVGPKGKRVFHLQAGKSDEIVTLTIEKEQAFALGEAIRELLEDLDKRYPQKRTQFARAITTTMELREPIESKFRVAQMGLGYDEDRDMVVLVAQELITPARETLDDDAESDDDFDEIESELEPESDDAPEPGIVRMWCSRDQMRALSQQSMNTVQSGRPDPKPNGRLVYYWT